MADFEEGRLYFRSAAGDALSAWLDEVDLLIVDRGGVFDDFNQAERYVADGQPEQAIARYRRTLRLSEDFWPDLITARLLAACDRAGRIDQAALNFVLVVRGEWSGPSAAARLIPQSIPSQRTAPAVRAIEHLEAASAKTSDEDQHAALELFLYELLRRTGDKRAAKAARKVAKMAIPPPQSCTRVCTIQLAALEAALVEKGGPQELASLDRAIRDCPMTVLPSLLLLKGQTLLRNASTREEVIRASWPFLRVVAHTPDDPRAADGLYGAARALERLGRPDQAVTLLTECLGHKGVGDATRQEAEAALKRLQSVDKAAE